MSNLPSGMEVCDDSVASEEEELGEGEGVYVVDRNSDVSVMDEVGSEIDSIHEGDDEGMLINEISKGGIAWQHWAWYRICDM